MEVPTLLQQLPLVGSISESTTSDLERVEILSRPPKFSGGVLYITRGDESFVCHSDVLPLL